MEKYQHYKGDFYEVLYEATHSETGELLVIYRSEEGRVFARPKSMFYEDVEVEGKFVPRFKKINK